MQTAPPRLAACDRCFRILGGLCFVLLGLLLQPRLIAQSPSISFQVSGATINEGDAGSAAVSVQVAMRADPRPQTPLTVLLAASDLTATNGLDYEIPAGASITFQPSGSATQTVDLEILGDLLVEGDESFNVFLLDVNGVQIAGTTAQIDIIDDDSLEVSIADMSFIEGSTAATRSLAISLSNPTAVPVQIQGVATDGTANSGLDYLAGTLVATVPTGSLSGSFSFDILGDAVSEPDETFTVDLTSVSVGSIDQGSATVTIVDDDGQPTITAADASGVEGDATGVVVAVPVSLSNASSQVVQVSYNSMDGTALAGSDYDPAAGVLTFAPGVTSGTVDVDLRGDVSVEGAEAFSIVFSQPQGATLASPSATVTIVDDDAAISLADSLLEATEGVNDLELVISRTGDLSQVLFLDVTYDGTATAGSDYVVGPSSVTLPSGLAELAVPLLVIDDADLETPIETLVATVSLSAASKTPNPSFATAGLPQQVLFQIHDNEQASVPTVQFSRLRRQVYEDQGSVILLVERRGDVSGSAGVELFVAGGSADEGSDFTFQSRRLDWAPGDGQPRSVRVDILESTQPEGTEQAVFQLRMPTSTGGLAPLALGSPAATVVEILERTGAAFVNSRIFVQEGATQIPLDVRRLGDPSGVLGVEVCVDGGTSSPADRDVYSTMLNWGSGDASLRSAALDVTDDAEVEPRENLLLSLCNPTSGVVMSSMTVYLLDNDLNTQPIEPLGFPSDGPENPAVAYGRKGQRVEVWQQNDSSGTGIWGRFIDRDGDQVGVDFLVNTEVAGDQTDPDVAVDYLGNFIVVWRDGPLQSQKSDDGTRMQGSASAGSAIVGRFFNPMAEPTSDEVVVSEADDDGSNSPNVSASNTGDAVITWEDSGEVLGRVYQPDTSPRTGILPLSDPREGRAAVPRSTVGASGDFVVVWREDVAARGAGSSNLVGRVFLEGGQPKSPKTTVSTNDSADSPAVAADDQGNFVVAWDQESPVSGFDVYARDFDRSGTARGLEFVVSSSTDGIQRAPTVDRNAIGDFVVVWEGDLPGAKASEGNLVGRFFDPSGSPQSGDVEIAATEDGSQPIDADVSMADRDQTTVVFEREGPGGAKEGIFSVTVEPMPLVEPCAATSVVSCLNEGRFSVDAGWQDFGLRNGDGQAQQLTDDTNYFWFFDAANVEVVVKVLDACAVNGHYWVFAAGLTDTEVNLRINDSASGETTTIFNPLGLGFRPVLDTEAFATCEMTSPRPAEGREDALARVFAEIESTSRSLGARSVSTAATCEPSSEQLCLNDDRFAVTVNWATDQGTGVGEQVQLTTDTGYFWFFDQANVEVVVKVLNACDTNGKYWVFAAGLTDVETDLQVVDGVTNAARNYVNESGSPFSVVLDTQSFNCE